MLSKWYSPLWPANTVARCASSYSPLDWPAVPLDRRVEHGEIRRKVLRAGEGARKDVATVVDHHRDDVSSASEFVVDAPDVGGPVLFETTEVAMGGE